MGFWNCSLRQGPKASPEDWSRCSILHVEGSDYSRLSPFPHTPVFIVQVRSSGSHSNPNSKLSQAREATYCRPAGELRGTYKKCSFGPTGTRTWCQYILRKTMNLQLILNSKKKKKYLARLGHRFYWPRSWIWAPGLCFLLTQAAPYLAAEGTAICDPCWQVTKKQAACWRKKIRKKMSFGIYFCYVWGIPWKNNVFIFSSPLLVAHNYWQTMAQ